MDNLFSTTRKDITDNCRVCEEETDVDLDVLQCTKVALCYECGTAYDADDEEVIYNLWGVISDKEMELKEDVEQKHVSIGLFKR